MHRDQFIEELAHSLNLPDLTFNKEQVCRIVLDDEFAIDVEWVEVSRAIYVYSAVRSQASDIQDRLAELLSANLFGRGTNDATLAFNPDEDAIMLTRRFEADQINVDWFLTQLDRFAESTARWIAILSQRSFSRPAPQDDDPVDHVADGFLQV